MRDDTPPAIAGWVSGWTNDRWTSHETCGVGKSDFLDRRSVRRVFHACSTLHASAAVNRDTCRMTVAMAEPQQECGSRQVNGDYYLRRPEPPPT